MIQAFQKISIAVLLLAAMGSAWSAPGDRQAWRESVRAERHAERQADRQNGIAERQGLDRPRDMQIGPDRRDRPIGPGFNPGPGPGFIPGVSPGVPPGGRFGMQGPQGDVPYGASPDGPRRPGRMTPEERRALRQQINEAGRDIYRGGR